MHIPSEQEFIAGIKQYEINEKRDAMYKVATFLISHHWGNPAEMADALGVLLLTWNQAFYRYGSFNFDTLEGTIRKDIGLLSELRARDIMSLSQQNAGMVKDLFSEFIDSLKIAAGTSAGKKSPVAVSKALHLLAPGFFPLWDDKIAKAYGLRYNQRPAKEEYIRFCFMNKELAERIEHYQVPTHRTLLKLIDQYNYSKYTQGWI
jgi:hypothetical protein